MKEKTETLYNFELQEDDKIFRIECKEDFFVIKMINCNELILKKSDFYSLFSFVQKTFTSEARKHFKREMMKRR